MMRRQRLWHLERKIHRQSNNKRNIQIENVAEFLYLGSILIWDNDCTRDIKMRIAKAKGVMAGFLNVWKSKQISYKIKVTLLSTCVFIVALFAS